MDTYKEAKLTHLPLCTKFLEVMVWEILWEV